MVMNKSNKNLIELGSNGILTVEEFNCACEASFKQENISLSFNCNDMIKLSQPDLGWIHCRRCSEQYNCDYFNICILMGYVEEQHD